MYVSLCTFGKFVYVRGFRGWAATYVHTAQEFKMFVRIVESPLSGPITVGHVNSPFFLVGKHGFDLGSLDYD